MGTALTAGSAKRIVCLANSRMSGGRCIAGKELRADGRAGAWIRPVSGWSTGALSEGERRYENGVEPRVLDVIDVAVVEARPAKYQRENWVIARERRWVKVGGMESGALAQWVDADPALWVNGHDSEHGENDRIPLRETDALESSLALIKVDALRVTVSDRRGSRVPYLRGAFRYNGDDYSLRITDAAAESGAVGMRHGDYDTDARFLTVSLTAEPYEDYCYKLIAAIIRP